MTVDMRSFLQQIKKTNDLFTVKKGVSTKYEIAAVTEKLDESKAAFEPSSFSVTAAISYFAETLFFTVNRSLVFLICCRKLLMSTVIFP